MDTRNKLSILVACYNEEKSIITMLEKVLAVELIGGIEKEIIVIDDASTDDTMPLLMSFMKINGHQPLQVFRNDKNLGKGASIRSAIEKSMGDFIVIQDADLEYDPADYNRLLKPIIDGHADVVYGSRFRGSEPHRVLFFFHTIGNKLLTFLSNVFTQLNLTDMETGYKMFKAGVLKSLRLKEKRFGFEPEVTAKLSRVSGIRIYEVGISYYGRTFDEGKKINWRDGFWSILCIFRYNIFNKK